MERPISLLVRIRMKGTFALIADLAAFKAPLMTLKQKNGPGIGEGV